MFATETGLRTNEWTALERRDIDRTGAAVTVQRRYADGTPDAVPEDRRVTPAVPLSDRALEALEAVPPTARHAAHCSPPRRAGTSASTRGEPASGIPALDAAGIPAEGRTACGTRSRPRRSPAGVSIFELARLMGTSVKVIDRTYGHLAVDSEDAIRARLNARSRSFWR